MLAWLRSVQLGGYKGISNVLKWSVFLTASTTYLLHCNFSSALVESTPGNLTTLDQTPQECSHTFSANYVDCLLGSRSRTSSTLRDLNFAYKFLLAVVVTILSFLLPFISNHQSVFNIKVKEVLARSTRTLCTRRRTTSSGKSSSTALLPATPTKRTHSKPAKCILFDDKLAIFFGTQARCTGIN